MKKVKRQAVGYFFDYYEQAPSRLIFLNWFLLHDVPGKDCEKLSSSFIPDKGAVSDALKEMFNPFSAFICNLGLIKNDGTPKAAWAEFVERAAKY
ncbi:hypothetical protein ACFL2Y_02475 [Candidatus Omnitrophota bacterium]